MSAIAELIETRRDDIVQRFAEHLYRTTASPALSREVVINSVGLFLIELAQALRTDTAFEAHQDHARRSPTASEHGKQRFELGYDVGAVVREYGALRDVLFDIVEEAGAVIEPLELRTLSKVLISGMADAATRYALERDEQMCAQASKHMGFLAHELRNPLASMRFALTQLEARPELGADRSLAVLGRGLDRLTRLIDAALIEVRLKGGVKAHLERISVPALVAELLEESDVEATLKQIRVESSVNVESVIADRKLVHSALSNLIRNAVKFTKPGGTIRILVRDAQGRVVFEVEDQCGGLPQGAVHKLFDPFVQMGSDRSGFGLGLAIAKQAVDAHEGTLRVHDVPRHGCVFVLELPTEGVES